MIKIMSEKNDFYKIVGGIALLLILLALAAGIQFFIH